MSTTAAAAGFGRAYRDRLQGRWGVLDVEDCVAGAQALVDRGLVDPAQLVIKGGSAGGYTTLQALTRSDVFTAGIVQYGVADLEALARDTHKFELRYLDGLVGPYPEAQAVYRDRSPIHHLDQLSAPILLLQGADDKVVPPSQTETLADAARAKGLPVAMIMFAGEGHGFRSAATIKAATEAQIDFLSRIYGFTPADPVPPIKIDNFPDHLDLVGRGSLVSISIQNRPKRVLVVEIDQHASCRMAVSRQGQSASAGDLRRRKSQSASSIRLVTVRPSRWARSRTASSKASGRFIDVRIRQSRIRR